MAGQMIEGAGNFRGSTYRKCKAGQTRSDDVIIFHQRRNKIAKYVAEGGKAMEEQDLAITSKETIADHTTARERKFGLYQ